MKITHSCGHQAEYDIHGSASYGLELIEKLQYVSCPNCQKRCPKCGDTEMCSCYA